MEVVTEAGTGTLAMIKIEMTVTQAVVRIMAIKIVMVVIKVEATTAMIGTITMVEIVASKEVLVALATNKSDAQAKACRSCLLKVRIAHHCSTSVI